MAADRDVQCKQLFDSVNKWKVSTKRQLRVKNSSEITPVKCKPVHKDDIVVLLREAFSYMEKQSEMLMSFREEDAAKNRQMIDLQSSVIKLQEDLIQAKDQQLQTVKSSVAETVKSEFVSFSDVVKAGCQSASPVVAQETIKTVIKKVAEEEDRTRSLMVWGLREEGDTKLNGQVPALWREA